MYMPDSEEESELEELRRLLERTTHELVANGARCGDVSTTTLRRLPDGQNESSVELFYRRKAEAEHAQQVSGMPAWDSTPYRGDEAPKPVHVPMRELLEDGKCTFEQRVYEPLMRAKREAKRNGEAEQAAPEHKLKPAHAEMIEQMMRAYRHEQGAPKVHSARGHGVTGEPMHAAAHPAFAAASTGLAEERRERSGQLVATRHAIGCCPSSLSLALSLSLSCLKYLTLTFCLFLASRHA